MSSQLDLENSDWKSKHTLVMLFVLRQLFSSSYAGQNSEELREKFILWGWVLCEAYQENIGKCDFLMTFALPDFTMRKIWRSMNSNKTHTTPNVNFLETGVSVNLSLGVDFPFASVSYLELNLGWGKEEDQGKAIITFYDQIFLKLVFWVTLRIFLINSDVEKSEIISV